MLKILEGSVSTVGELLKMLKNIPEDYSISLSGMNSYSIAVDDENKYILLDDTNWIEETIYQINEELL